MGTVLELCLHGGDAPVFVFSVGRGLAGCSLRLPHLLLARLASRTQALQGGSPLDVFCPPPTLNQARSIFEVIQGNSVLSRAGKQRRGLKITEK